MSPQGVSDAVFSETPEHSSPETVFRRTARSYPDPLPSEAIRIVPPPVRQQGGTQGMMWMFFLLPMLMGTGGYFLFGFPGGRWATVLTIATAGLTVGILAYYIIGQWRGKRRREASIRRRYLDYLDGISRNLEDVRQRQRQYYARLFPMPSELALLSRERRVAFERRRGDDDFLCVPVGRTDLPLSRPLIVDLDDNPLTEYHASLLDALQTLRSNYANVANLPWVVEFGTIGIMGIRGRRDGVLGLLHATLSHMALFHSPGDLRLMVLACSDQGDDWSWIRWLPHNRVRQMASDINPAICHLAGTFEETLNLWEAHVVPRLARPSSDPAAQENETFAKVPNVPLLPHLVVILDDFDPLTWPEEIVRQLDGWRAGAPTDVTLLVVSGESHTEPAELDARIIVTDDGQLDFEIVSFRGPRRRGITADWLSAPDAEQVARALSPLGAVDGLEPLDITETVRLVDLTDTPQWAKPSRVEDGTFLTIPLGRSADNTVLTLDLKEAALGGMGPHGLVIGATGSGKSELLRSLVAGVAVRHSPEELNVLFVDYKGGASFGELAHIPHSAGLITNLERRANLADRVRDALYGELERRQHLLRDAGQLNTIADYARIRRDRTDLPALPHLLIVVDEFSELLVDREDFLDLFITIGRTGRSLGLYLLLASQRLEEGRIQGLESHLRYRIALRTFSSMESSAVLGRPDAYYLPPFPGVGYLQVDARQDLFKAATVSLPARADISDTPSSPRLFLPSGRIVREALLVPDGSGTDLHRLMQQVTERWGHLPSVHPVWLDPLPDVVWLSQLLDCSEPNAESLWIPIGLVDLPREQRQTVFGVDLAGTGGHLAVVGAPRTGKSTFLRTFVMSLGVCHSPRDVICYGLDFGGGGLRSLSGLPVFGALAGLARPEEVAAMLRFVRGTIDHRRRLFENCGVESISQFRQASATTGEAGANLEEIFLIVDGLGAMGYETRQAYMDDLLDIAARGLQVGVHLVVSGFRWADLGLKLRDLIGTRIELSLHDPEDSLLGVKIQKRLAGSSPGRALTQNGEVFQVADSGSGSDSEEFRRLAERIGRRAGGHRAPSLVVLPGRVETTDLRLRPGDLGIPVGIAEMDSYAVSLDLFRQDPHFIVFGDQGSGKTTFLRTWITNLLERRPDAQLILMDPRGTLQDFAGKRPIRAYARTSGDIGSCIGLADTGGSRRIFFVDDYDWIAQGGMSHALTPLAEHLLSGADTGFHLVLTRRVGGTSRSAFDPVLQRLREMGTPGLILSGDPAEGPLIGREKASVMRPGRGYLVRRNHETVLMQVALPGDLAQPL